MESKQRTSTSCRLFLSAEEAFECFDTSDSIIKTRIETYHKKTEPLIDFYKKSNKYCKIDGEGSIEEIFKRVEAIL